MCPNLNPEKAQTTSANSLAAILQYEPPALKENKAGCYIEFRAFDPAAGKLRRKTIKLNHISGLTNRRVYAKGLITRLNQQLQNGWNPWIAHGTSGLSLFADALDRYERYIDKMFEDGLYRKETYVGYKSYIKILRGYSEKDNKIYYLYQFDRKFCSNFLDYVFITRDCGAQTRNNYLGFLRIFSGYLLDKGLLDHRPTDGIRPISKRLFKKERTTIPTVKLREITSYLKKNDPYFLTACYLLFYCFIRPAELVRLRIQDFDLKSSTVTISADNSKNHKKQTVTIPRKVLLYMIDQKIFASPLSDYLFSIKLSPGPDPIDTKIFRDHWEKIRKALDLDKCWKFYSLKDTGITELLTLKFGANAVKDQARHSSLAITDIYVEKQNGPNNEIIDHDGSL